MKNHSYRGGLEEIVLRCKRFFILLWDVEFVASRNKKKPVFFSGGLFFFALSLWSAHVDAQSILFDVPQQSADRALTELADQADITVAFDYSVVSQFQSGSVAGSYSIEEAVELLLASTPLTHEFRDSGHLVITHDDSEESNKTESSASKNIFAEAIRFLAGTGSTQQPNSQDTETDQRSLEEIVVTGRKREETLQEVPVSISVLGENLIREAGILDQYDLFGMVPGLHYDETFSRNNAQASVRGVQQTGNLPKATKVNAFVDGMPILGSQGAIGFGNVQQIEIYRGPQSAAFGRSTFGGAINYVTRDPGEVFDGNLSTNISNFGTRILSASIGGPITDSLGYQVDAEMEDSTAPNAYIGTDGTHYGEREGNNISGKLVWKPRDDFSARLMFSHSEIDDAPQVEHFITEAARDACAGEVGEIGASEIDSFISAGRGGGIYNVGLIDCDWQQGAQIIAQNDREAFLRNDVNGQGDLAAYASAARAAGASDATSVTGSVEEDILLVAAGRSLPASYVGSYADRDRASIQFEYTTESDHIVQLTTMISEEKLGSSDDSGRNYTDSLEVAYNGDTGFYEVVNGPLDESITAELTYIDETYAEIRWVSPADQRLRYVAGVSRYEYDYFYVRHMDHGYGHIHGGFVDEYFALTGVDPTADISSISEYATNTGIFLNITYDLSDNLTMTFEGRRQTDDIESIEPNTGNTGGIKTTSYIPRLSLNYNINEEASFYAQYAEGVNPGGVNTNLFNDRPDESAALLDNGIPDGFGNRPDGTTNPICTGDATATDTACNSFYVDYESADFNTFPEETLTSFEIGVKGSAFDGRLQYTGALYSLEWGGQLNATNLNWDHPNAARRGETPSVTEITEGEYNPYGLTYVVEPYSNTGTRAVISGGDVKIRGFEMEANYSLNNSWSIRGTASYMRSEYFNDYCHVGIEADGIGEQANLPLLTVGNDEVLADCMIIDGKEVSRQPHLTWSLSPRFNRDIGNGLGLSGRADILYESEQWRDVANVGKTPAVTTVNFSLGLSGDAWSTALYVNNLFDNDTPRQFSSGSDPSITSDTAYLEDNNYLVDPRSPRTIGLRTAFNF